MDDVTQLSVGSMYLDNEKWQWWKLHQCCYGRPLAWQTFKKALTDHFDHESNFLGHLTKLRQKRTVNEYITSFESLAFRTRGLHDEFYVECFVSGLKEAIQAHVQLHHLISWLHACKIAHEVERALVAQYNRPNFISKGHPAQAQSTTQTLKVQKVSPTEMEKRRKQGLCYYCDEKYSPRHKCKEPKFFQIDATDHSSSKEAPPLEEPKEEGEDN